MIDLALELRKRKTLHTAWHKVRSNGLSSSSNETKAQVKKFESNYLRNLESIYEQLSRGTFTFGAQYGVAEKKNKSSGSYRPIVIAPIENRIVQRALLDILHDRVPAVQAILDTPTSIGGIPARGVGHALSIIKHEIASGANYYIRSDIPDFFSNIPKKSLLEFIDSEVGDTNFKRLLSDAITVQLANYEELGEHKELFPIGDNGVAQGSPLSPLMGNILLKEFDSKMNGRGIRCIRYIDDFLILGGSLSKVRSAMKSATKLLKTYGLEAYKPQDRPDKASEGEIGKGFDFLGYHLQPGLITPSSSAQSALLNKIEVIIAQGIKNVRTAIKNLSSKPPPQCYVQTLKLIGDVIRGWGHAFKYSNSSQVMLALDKKLNSRIEHFESAYNAIVGASNYKLKQRALGVQLLEDVPLKDLPGTQL